MPTHKREQGCPGLVTSSNPPGISHFFAPDMPRIIIAIHSVRHLVEPPQAAPCTWCSPRKLRQAPGAAPASCVRHLVEPPQAASIKATVPFATTLTIQPACLPSLPPRVWPRHLSHRPLLAGPFIGRSAPGTVACLPMQGLLLEGPHWEQWPACPHRAFDWMVRTGNTSDGPCRVFYHRQEDPQRDLPWAPDLALSHALLSNLLSCLATCCLAFPAQWNRCTM
eukprot:366247-Chlamydomonas_euryale.AAC.13